MPIAIETNLQRRTSSRMRRKPSAETGCADWPAMILRQLVRHRAALPEDDTLVVAAYWG